jgi:hypothetical protein
MGLCPGCGVEHIGVHCPKIGKGFKMTEEKKIYDVPALRQDREVINFEEYAMTPVGVLKQVAMVHEVMTAVMKENEHFGTIPGTKKPSLYKAGAEKLSLTFRLRPEYEIRKSELPNGHREYEVVCTLYHIPTGQSVGQGVGSATTMEGKYRYRGGEKEGTGKPIPKDYWNLNKTDPKKAQELIGGRGFSAGKIDGKWEICSTGEKQEHDNPADYYNCVTPDTKVLTHDLQWVPAGEIESGDMLVGVEENMTNEYARHFAVGEATVYGRKIDDLYEMTFEDGRIVRCNGEHKWLVKKVGLKGTEWISTQDINQEIIERKGRPRNWSVMSACTPWDEDQSKEAGYIAGLLDADGSLGVTQLFVMFAQQDNIVLSLLKQGLTARGYNLGTSKCKTAEAFEQAASQKQVYQLRVLGGFTEQLRLLGSIRPPRLMERWLTLIDLDNRRLEGRGSGAGRPVQIVSIEPIGKGEIVMLGTACKTYIAEGLVCHNTVLKMAKKRAHVDAILTATAASDIFTQDVEDMPEVIAGAKKESTKEETAPLPDKPPAESKPIPATGEQIAALKSLMTGAGMTDNDDQRKFWSFVLPRGKNTTENAAEWIANFDAKLREYFDFIDKQAAKGE